MQILNFGALNIDRVYSVPHFVEAGETLSSHHMRESVGGKGLNQSIAMARAGLKVKHAGMVGTDGGMLLKELVSAGVDISLVNTAQTVATGHAIIQVDPNGQNNIILYGGANHAIEKSYVDMVLANFASGDYIFLQNEISCLPYIMESARKKEMVVVFNPSPMDDNVRHCDLSAAAWFILNEVEGFAMTNETIPEKICSKLISDYPNANVVLTLGGDGAVFCNGAEFIRQAAAPVAVVDSTAAGDTFTGYFFAAIYNGKAPAEALKLASVAASITVSRQGSSQSIPNIEEVLRLGGF